MAERSTPIGGHVFVAGGLAKGGRRTRPDGAEVIRCVARGAGAARGGPGRTRGCASPACRPTSTPPTSSTRLPTPRRCATRWSRCGSCASRAPRSAAAWWCTRSAVSQAHEQALRQVRENLLPLLDDPRGRPDLLLESMAGQGCCAPPCRTSSRTSPRSTFTRGRRCASTPATCCRGPDLAPGGVRTLGGSPPGGSLIHANDSRTRAAPPTARNIGAGHRRAGVRRIMRHPVAAGVPPASDPGRAQASRGHRAEEAARQRLTGARLARSVRRGGWAADTPPRMVYRSARGVAHAATPAAGPSPAGHRRMLRRPHPSPGDAAAEITV